MGLIRVNIANQRFGRLVALVQMATCGQSKWLCKCDCGTELIVMANHLRRGNTQSCGCVRNEFSSLKYFTQKDGSRGGNRPEYALWARIKDKCNNPDNAAYEYYGGRGIRFYQGWADSFETFLEYIGPKPSTRHSLDRWPNNDGNYEPGNVRWAVMKQQNNNTRRTRRILYNGQVKSMMEWCEDLGLDYQLVSYRIDKGIPIDKAFLAKPQDIRFKKIIQLSKDGLFIMEHESIKSAAKSVGLATSGPIWTCLNGGTKKAGGFRWKYAEGFNRQLEIRYAFGFIN